MCIHANDPVMAVVREFPVIDEPFNYFRTGFRVVAVIPGRDHLLLAFFLTTFVAHLIDCFDQDGLTGRSFEFTGQPDHPVPARRRLPHLPRFASFFTLLLNPFELEWIAMTTTVKVFVFHFSFFTAIPFARKRFSSLSRSTSGRSTAAIDSRASRTE